MLGQGRERFACSVFLGRNELSGRVGWIPATWVFMPGMAHVRWGPAWRQVPVPPPLPLAPLPAQRATAGTERGLSLQLAGWESLVRKKSLIFESNQLVIQYICNWQEKLLL